MNHSEHNEVILDVQNLAVSFRTNNGNVQAVRDISFTLKKGETLAIVGESGSGKSVTGKAILGILAPNSIIEGGQILYDDKELLHLSEEEFNKLRGNKITMIFQDPMSSLDPIMKIGKQMTEATLLNAKTNRKYAKKAFKLRLKRLKKDMETAGVSAAQANEELKQFETLLQSYGGNSREVSLMKEKRSEFLNSDFMKQFQVRLVQVLGGEGATNAFLHYMLDQVDLMNRFVTKKEAYDQAIKIMADVGIREPEKRFHQYPFEFSGGMRQRIVIAIALAANPDILICDEPTTALDVTIQAQILELIAELKERRRLSVIFITHDLGVVANIADEVAVMYAGKIVEHGTVDDIFYEPKHPYTWALLSSMPDLDTKETLSSIPGTPPNMIHPPKGDAFAARNQYAMAIDFEEQPPLFQVSPTHYAATWLLHPDAPKIDPPEIVLDRIARMKYLNEEAEKKEAK
ncbi:MAG: ABC transporter ATP-binding protein [Lachnospiraceae bacterium]|jgi:oligopeptide transport system ATP-binding protein|nr:ABC transporter ATP-binding protein [Lachnospiraceae bacterium]